MSTSASRSTFPGWALVLPLPLSTLMLAAVHPIPRAVVALLATAIGVLAWRSGSTRRLGTGARIALGGALLAWGSGFLSLFPVDARLRDVLQGELGAAISEALSLTGSTHRALAVDLPAAFEALGWAGAMLTLAAGTAAASRSRPQRLRLAWTVSATATCTAILALIQHVAGFETILGITDIPLHRRDTAFATFVNPNHAGTLLAAGACLSASMLGRPRPHARLLGGLTTVICLLGVVATGSRGAMLSCAVGTAVVLGVAAPVRVTLGSIGLATAAGATTFVVGGRDVWNRVSARLAGPGPDGDPWSGRPEFWSDAVELLRTAPILGVGPGGYDLASRWAKTSPRFIVPRHAHMEPLQAMVEWGIPGGLLWIAVGIIPVILGSLVAARLARGRRRTTQAGWLGAAAAILVASTFDFPLRIGTLSVLAALAWGVLCASAPSSSHRPVRFIGIPLLIASVVGVLASGAPLRDRLLPGSMFAPGEVQLAEADEARRQARDLHLLDMGDPDPWRETAREALHDRLQARAVDIQPLLRLAQLELDAARPRAARPFLEAATGLQPTMPWPWLGLARAAAADDDPRSAHHAWRRGLSLNLPDNDDARPWVQRALASGNDIDAWNAMIPDRPDRLRDAGTRLALDGERLAAESMFARGEALDPRVAVPWARWLVAWGEPEAALERISTVQDRGCQSLRVRGEALLAAGRPADALPWLQDARAICKEGPGLQRAYALALAAGGRASDLRELETWLTGRPQDHAARRVFIGALRARHEWGRIAPQLEFLIEAGVATQAEQADLPRARLGLPLP